jgi:hypothetical protein
MEEMPLSQVRSTTQRGAKERRDPYSIGQNIHLLERYLFYRPDQSNPEGRLLFSAEVSFVLKLACGRGASSKALTNI